MKKFMKSLLFTVCISLLIILVSFNYSKMDFTFPSAKDYPGGQFENNESLPGLTQDAGFSMDIAPKSKEQKLMGLVKEFQRKVREESSSSLDAYVYMMPLEQFLREDAEAFALFQEQVYEKLISAEEPLERIEDALLFPIVAYVDQSGAQDLLIRVIEGTSAESEAYENYVLMLGEWMINERAVQTLLALGMDGLPGLEKGMDNFAHSGGERLQKSREIVQREMESMEKQGQDHSSLYRSYAKILKKHHN